MPETDIGFDGHESDGLWLSLHDQAKSAERQQMLSDLKRALTPLTIADVGSGPGVWHRRLSSTFPDAMVVSLDVDLLQLRSVPSPVVAGDTCRLPFRDDSVDLIWCANCLMYAENPIFALREFVRCVRPGGLIAVKEEDCGRDILLPWPEDLDIAVRRAWHIASAHEEKFVGSQYLGRSLGQLMVDAGVESVRAQSYSMDRYFPYEKAVVGYVKHAFLDYLPALRPILGDADADRVVCYLEEDHPESIWRTPGSSVLFIETVVTGRSVPRA